MKSDDRAAVLVPLGDFLTAEEPVWVWDVEARRILWANSAGRAFWGASTQEALRARRFGTHDKAAARMGVLVATPGTRGEWTETFTLSSAAGRVPVQCTLQALQIAGGRKGLIVRALNASGSGAKPKTKAMTSARTGKHVVPDESRAALGAIAARMNAAVPSELRKPRRARVPPAAAVITSAPEAPAPQKIRAPKTSAINPLGDEPYHMPDALTLMLRELCHELRNPLTVILGFAERIRDSGLIRRNPEKAQSYAGNIMESAELAMEILADFSARVLRPGAGLPQPEPVEIGPIVARCLQLITPLATQAGLKVSKTAGKTLPRLHISERALKQILLNVLMNAVRHQKTGGLVRVAARKLKDGAVRLTISDDGIGMTKKEIRRAMGEVRSPPPEPAPGRSGLGLPLVKKLVESTGGTLSIASERRKGTTIGILFPASATVPM